MLPSVSADAGRPSAAAAQGCTPGSYTGKYSCDITLFSLVPFYIDGDVSFSLERDETVVQSCKPGEEFCADLVIAKNSGVLSGLAERDYAFSAKLDGGLDCKTGAFRAAVVDGRWGLAVANADPSAVPEVEEPPLGLFDGELKGMHETSGQETISGTWNLFDHEADIRCEGPFSATLQK